MTSPKQDLNLIVVGASEGGLQAVAQFLSGLPALPKVAILAVIHVHPNSPMITAGLLQRATLHEVCYPEDGRKITAGRVYVAPPARHLLVNGSRLRLIDGPRMNFHQPAVDPLFLSAAKFYGSKVTAVILTGNLYDGTWGARAVKEGGGIVMVQDPMEAVAPDMPKSVLRWVPGVDFCGSISNIAVKISQRLECDT